MSNHSITPSANSFTFALINLLSTWQRLNFSSSYSFFYQCGRFPNSQTMVSQCCQFLRAYCLDLPHSTLTKGSSLSNQFFLILYIFIPHGSLYFNSLTHKDQCMFTFIPNSPISLITLCQSHPTISIHSINVRSQQQIIVLNFT